ncbi:MAG: hypothetical protein DLM54_06390 [Acidimicrobiales bacterium]|nr:MAG: hypothetical protein DLM54_06390 [Acidimicrobiales bacterium]
MTGVQLSDPWTARLVKGAGIHPGDLVIDIGAGSGALTAQLLSAGARVMAVELHPARAKHLQARFRDQPVVVLQVNATYLRLPRQPFRVVANPPFAVTTALLRRFLAPSSRLLSADLVLPSQGGRLVGRRPGPGGATVVPYLRSPGGETAPSRSVPPPAHRPHRCTAHRTAWAGRGRSECAAGRVARNSWVLGVRALPRCPLSGGLRLPRESRVMKRVIRRPARPPGRRPGAAPLHLVAQSAGGWRAAGRGSGRGQPGPGARPG